ncbi:hypothetical protein BAC3_00648 [uncultured bacterium]|nr:hypothetical protein BAC3_00648 [uncultured bacterium]
MPIRTPNECLLTNTGKITVGKYLEMEEQRDAKGIADLVHERFYERYIKPFKYSEYKNGFIMMASACLMIEALESFWQGWPKSPNSALAFCQFFDRNSRFSSLRGSSQDFYSNVRCGIMHQGETTNGWRISRKLHTLFDSPSKTIDATRFLKEMENSLLDYCATLEKAAWNSQQWKNLRKKMKSVCDNTKQKE